MTEKLYLENLKAVKDLDITIYKEALDNALNDKNNTNIALSGSYGSGKSSIIESYKKHEDVRYRFLHISLAQFDTDIKGDNHQKRQQSVEKNLEGKILNQLLHQIKTSKIPQTIFKVKRKISVSKLLIWSCLVSLATLLIIYVIGYNNWRSFYVNNFNNSTIMSFFEFTTIPETRLMAFIVLFIIFTFTIFVLAKAQLNKRIIQKISVKGNEIEVLKESKESYFDKYLNDVIYLFENADADVIVFEDIDRYNSQKIFEKLLEINTLVNARNTKGFSHNSRSKFIKLLSATKFFRNIRRWNFIERIHHLLFPKRKIIFLYLLRDDVFLSKDRTKFFDLIIPVVPVIDASNSYEKFISIFKKGKIVDLFNQKFLQKLSLYVDDMRLLKNIYNEFIIYHKEINKINLDVNKLLALITYKNIFPKDFSDLQLSKGFVYSLIQKKEEFINKNAEKIDEEILELKARIELSEDEMLNNIDELDAVYLSLGNPIMVNGKLEDSFKTRIDFIKNIKKESSEIKINVNPFRSSSWKITNKEELFKKMNSIPEYTERKEIIKDKLNIEELVRKKESLLRKRELLQSSRLKNVITPSDIKQHTIKNVLNEEEKFEYIKRSDYFPLVTFLIRNGYIDESYSDYMTYFYPNSLTKNDRLFLRSITDENKLNWDFQLIKIEQVIDRMEIYDFSNIESWNFDLLNYMLEKDYLFKENIERVILSLSENRELDFFKRLFILNQQEKKDNNVKFLKLIFKHWEGFSNQLLKSQDSSLINSTLEVALRFLDNTLINYQNRNNEFTEYLNTSPAFFNELIEYSPKMINNLELMNLKTKNVIFNKLEENTAKAIYTKSLYKINYHNIKSILEYFYNITDHKKIKHSNFSLIKEAKATELLEYIKDNINEYWSDAYIENTDGKINDYEDVACDLINDNTFSKQNKKEYISRLDTTISDIKKISDSELWKTLIENNTVAPNANNIIEYYILKGKSWTNELISFVNQSKTEIVIDLDKAIRDNGKINLFLNTMKCYDLENRQYRSLMKSMKDSYIKDIEGVNKLSITNLPDDKMSILINEGIIEMSKDILLTIRKHYSASLIDFIAYNLGKYLDIISDDEIHVEEELLNVLKNSQSIMESNIKLIIDSIKCSISVVDQNNYSDDTIKYILEKKFNIKDLDELISSYKLYSTSIQRKIINLCIEHVDIILTNNIKIKSPELLCEILKSEQVHLNSRQRIFSNNLIILDKENIKELIGVLFFPKEFLYLFQGKRPEIEKNNMNKKILDHFKNMNWITSYQDKDKTYWAIGKKEK